MRFLTVPGLNWTGRFWLPAALALVLPAVSDAAPTLTVDPPSLATDDVGELQMDVGAVVGSEIILRLYVDADGDGTVDPEDYPIWSGAIGDNAMGWSPSMLADLDPATGALTVDLRLAGALEFPYSAGTFIWQAEDVFDGSTATASFAVTQALQSQRVTGTVTDSSTATVGTITQSRSHTSVAESCIARAAEY